MLNVLAEQGLKPRTVSNVRAVLRKALNQAMRWGYVVRNVATLVDAPRTTTFSFHDLRHSCATLLIVQSVHPRVIMEILGHSQISTTMNTYAHVLPATQREATAKIDALFPERAAPDNDDGNDAPLCRQETSAAATR